jgi:hypothetical protein
VELEKRTPMKKFALGLLVGIVLGGIGMGLYSRHANYELKERELAGLSVLLHVWDAGLATRVLEVMDEERYDTARKLIASHRDAGIDASYRMFASERPRVDPFGARNLVPELDRIAAYLVETDPDSSLVEWTQDLKEHLQRASVEM